MMYERAPGDQPVRDDGFVSIPATDAEAIWVDGQRGQRLRLYRLRPRSDGAPPVLFGHACGFAAGAYLPLLKEASAFADVFAYDARGHGGSDSNPEDLSLYGADDYALDLAQLGRAVAAHTGGRPLTFVGHSMEAGSLLRLACCHPGVFAAVNWRAALLFEPPVFPSSDRPEYADAVEKDRVTRMRTHHRRRDWATREALVAALTGRGLFRDVAPEFLQAYAHAALRPSASGFTLACAPAIEEATFASYANEVTFRALPDFPQTVPLHLVAGVAGTGAETLWPTGFAPAIAERLGCGTRHDRRFTQLAGRSHLMIQEDPRAARDLIHNLVASR